MRRGIGTCTGPAREVSRILYSSGPCTSLSPGARTPTVPSPLPTSGSAAGRCSCHRSDSCRPAASASCTGRHRPVAPSLSPSLSLSLPVEFAHSAIRAALPATRAPRSTTNATYALSLLPARCFPALLAHVAPHAASRPLYRTRATPSRTTPRGELRVTRYPHMHTRGNARVCKKTWRKRISDASRRR